MSKLYFAYDSEDGFETFDTPEQARKCAKRNIDAWKETVYPGEEWCEEVERVCWGVVKETAQEIRVKNEDKEELGGPEFYADYELKEIS